MWTVINSQKPVHSHMCHVETIELIFFSEFVPVRRAFLMPQHVSHHAPLDSNGHFGGRRNRREGAHARMRMRASERASEGASERARETEREQERRRDGVERLGGGGGGRGKERERL